MLGYLALMYIAKPFRVLVCGIVGGAGAVLTFAFLQKHIDSWAVIPTLISIPIFWFLGEWPVNKFDFWLRRVTRDPIWVRQQERNKRTP